MPYSHDQPDNAARLARLGTSRTVPRDYYSAPRAAWELRELLADSKYRQKAEEAGRIVSAEDGLTAACDAIEGQL
jgi:UDP:flavonoid glycosyltransferase YjiC (YdhE family)